MKLYNGKQLARAMGVPPVFITAMKAAGYQFLYQHQTTLQHALDWRGAPENRHFRYSDYIDSKRRRNGN